jgi:hypothetical protein
MKQTVEEAAQQELMSSYAIVVEGELAYQRQAMLNMFRKGAEWQSRQSPWISVKERPPKHNIKVIICHECEFYIGKMYRSMQSNWWRVSDDERTDIIVSEDDSWMPIPIF